MDTVIQSLTVARDYARYLMGTDTQESQLTLERRDDDMFLRRNRGQDGYSVQLSAGVISGQNVVSHDMHRYSVIYRELPKTELISEWTVIFGGYPISGGSLHSEYRARDDVIIVSEHPGTTPILTLNRE